MRAIANEGRCGVPENLDEREGYRRTRTSKVSSQVAAGVSTAYAYAITVITTFPATTLPHGDNADFPWFHRHPHSLAIGWLFRLD
jgi:hypothetical protein